MEELEKGPLREFTPCRFDTIEKTVKALAVVHTGLGLVWGTYLSYLRNLIFDEHVFVQLKEKRTVSRFYFYKRVGSDRVLKEKENAYFGKYGRQMVNIN
jgi:hypothetical protein